MHDVKLPVNYDKLHYRERRIIRNEYIRRQDGLCKHCNEPLNGAPSSEVSCLRVNEDLFPQNFFKWAVHLHHDRNTSMTIGAVHCYCNAVLWQYHGE